MYAPNFDWREEPRRLSVYSLTLLVIFVTAVTGLIVYIAAVLAPWGGPGVDSQDARTYADRGLTPLPPGHIPQPQ
jgi:hypothetical protein